MQTEMVSNIEKSELVIAKVLRLLVERGLTESRLTFRSLGLNDEYEPFFKTCFLWLIDEGLIRSRTNIESITSIFHAYDPVLTAKGFTVLGSKLQVQGGQITMASAIEQTASENRSLSGIGDFFGGLLGGFTKSISS